LALRDVETEGHSRRVAAWTLLLVQRLGMPEDQWLDAELGGLLHDIGKIGIPDAILRKPGKLDAEEWVAMRRHPELGCTILAGIPALRGAYEIVRSHHERWDGAGYPDGLAGDAIPLRARVFAMVDTYDAVTCDRPYRKGRSHAEAVALIQGETGTQFDPRMVQVFAAVPEPEWAAVARVFADQGAAQRG
jgi:HD-GYP domain-containing protein (c-di-GMP phosphodiesterase class II)